MIGSVEVQLGAETSFDLGVAIEFRPATGVAEPSHRRKPETGTLWLRTPTPAIGKGSAVRSRLRIGRLRQ